jgi:hypothetical protein
VRKTTFLFLCCCWLLTPVFAGAEEQAKPLKPVEYYLYARERYEVHNNYDFNNSKDDSQDFVGHKWRLGNKFNGKDASGLLELQYSKKDLNTNCSCDLYQAFAELGKGIKLKLGRQEFKYGDGYLISPSAWSNIGRSFDAAVVKFKKGKIKADVFASKLVKYHGSPAGDDQFFNGIYTTSTFSKSSSLDLYFLNKTLAGGGVGKNNLNFYTMGIRAFGNKGNFDYNADFISQFGNNGVKKQKAGGAYINCGYTWQTRWKPRLGLEYLYASGNKDPNGNTTGTFDSLYGTTHNFCGFMDLVALKNIKDTQAGLDVTPLKNITLSLDYHIFKLDQARDAFYRLSPTQPVLQDKTGRCGTDAGKELDLTCYYKIKDLALEAGYYTFYPGGAVKSILKNNQPAKPNMFYFSAEYRI